jgi:HEAT repeat protein
MFQNALKVLLAALDSTSEASDTRREAAFAAGMIGSNSAIPILTKYTANSDPYLAEICKEGLIRLR